VRMTSSPGRLRGTGRRAGIALDQVAQGLLASAASPPPSVRGCSATAAPAVRRSPGTSGSCPGLFGSIDGLSWPGAVSAREPLAVQPAVRRRRHLRQCAGGGSRSTSRALTARPCFSLSLPLCRPGPSRLSPAQGTAPPAPPGAAGLERVLRLLGELAPPAGSSDLSRIIAQAGGTARRAASCTGPSRRCCPFFSLNQQLGALATGRPFRGAEEPKIIRHRDCAQRRAPFLRCSPGAPTLRLARENAWRMRAGNPALFRPIRVRRRAGPTFRR